MIAVKNPPSETKSAPTFDSLKPTGKSMPLPSAFGNLPEIAGTDGEYGTRRDSQSFGPLGEQGPVFGGDESSVPASDPAVAIAAEPPAAAEAMPDGKPPEAAKTTEADKKPEEFPAHLLELAEMEGLKHGDDFSSPAELQRTLKALDRQRISLGNQLLQAPQTAGYETPSPGRAGPAAQSSHAALPVPPSAMPGFDEKTLAEAIRQIEATGGPELAAPMKLLVESTRQQQQAFAQQQRAMQDHYQQAEMNRFYDQVDQGFAALGEHFAPVVGHGSRWELGPRSAEMQARQAVFQDVLALAASYERQGLQPPVAQLVKRAAYGRFGDKITAVATAASKTQTVERVRNRQGQFMAPPTNAEPMSGAVADPVKSAQNAVGAKLQKWGIRE